MVFDSVFTEQKWHTNKNDCICIQTPGKPAFRKGIWSNLLWCFKEVSLHMRLRPSPRTGKCPMSKVDIFLQFMITK